MAKHARFFACTGPNLRSKLVFLRSEVRHTFVTCHLTMHLPGSLCHFPEAN